MYIKEKINNLFSPFRRSLHDGAGEEIPPAQVAEEFSSIRKFLRSQIKPDSLVALRLNHDYRYLLCIYACMESGVTYVPLKPEWPNSRIEQIKNLTAFSFIIDGSNIESICRFDGPQPLHGPEITPDSPLYVICTSGSTGVPKGVAIPRKAYENFLRWLDDHFNGSYGPGERLLLTTEYTFDVSLVDIGLFLLKNPSMYFSRFGGNFFKLAAEIEQYRITNLNTVPNNISMLLSDGVYERADLSSLRSLLLGGSRFSYSAYRSILEKLPRSVTTYNFYGPTEATVYCHFKRLTGSEADDSLESNISIGKPLLGVTCQIVDKDGKEVAKAGETGELLLGGKQLMTEYVGNPQKTREALFELNGQTFYKTGDLAFFDGKGDYYVTGRMDDTLKRKGFRVNLLDIDAYIQKIDGVQDSATIAVAHPEFEHLLVTYIIPASDSISKNELMRKMGENLVDYQIPDRIEFIKQFPTNNSGKISRISLEQMFRGTL